MTIPWTGTSFFLSKDFIEREPEVSAVRRQLIEDGITPLIGLSDMIRPYEAKLSAFEKKVKELGLPPYQYAGSRELRRWCSDNMYRKFVPETLLNTWGLYVNPEDERLYGAEPNN